MIENAVAEEIRSTAVAAAEAIYRLSQLKGFDPALRFELRKYAIGILSRVAVLGVAAGARGHDAASELLADIAGVEELIGFAVARGFIAQRNAELVLGAYRRVRESIGELKDGGGVGYSEEMRLLAVQNIGIFTENNENAGVGLNERQRRILEHIAGLGHTQISDIRSMFSASCSERTLQRDLWQLIDYGLIRRQGDTRWTIYSLSKRGGNFIKTNVG